MLTPPHLRQRARRRARAAARATALLDAAYRASANQDEHLEGLTRTRVRTSMVRFDEERSGFAFAVDDAVRWNAGLRTFVVPPALTEGDVLVLLGPGPVVAIQAARRILLDAETGGRVARAERTHARGIDALAVIMPGLGSLLNAGTALLK